MGKKSHVIVLIGLIISAFGSIFAPGLASWEPPLSLRPWLASFLLMPSAWFCFALAIRGFMDPSGKCAWVAGIFAGCEFFKLVGTALSYLAAGLAHGNRLVANGDMQPIRWLIGASFSFIGLSVILS